MRLKYAYIIKCDSVMKDTAGNVTELHCSVDLESKTGGPTAGRKVKGTLHWVSAAQAVPVEVRLYDRLFKVEDLNQMDGDFKDYLNPDSLKSLNTTWMPPVLCQPNSATTRS